MAAPPDGQREVWGELDHCFLKGLWSESPIKIVCQELTGLVNYLITDD